ncbi:MAG TPA: tetratricopeptide repeat protein, partial [Petrotogaceae bacterium]|jgi:Tfp pilus assembly protein PilF|nr:tetratricopeptide repeat protein [Petrotogaceae bacterium]
MNDMKKSEENFKKAIEKEPLYVNAYLELGMLYLKINKKELAREMFNKVISMQPHPEWRKQGEEAKKTAEDELKKIK